MNNPVVIQWRKSSSCIGGSNCVEVAQLPGGLVGVRDSKDPEGAALTFGARQWDGFVTALRKEPLR